MRCLPQAIKDKLELFLLGFVAGADQRATALRQHHRENVVVAHLVFDPIFFPCESGVKSLLFD